MKTNELIKHLRFCGDPEACCIGCSRLDETGVDGGTNACMCDLMQKAANAIEELRLQLESHRDSENAIRLEEKQATSDGWIPVTERLPDLIPCDAGTAYSEAVNVLTSGRKVLTAIWDGSDFIADADFWDAEGEEITHWTPVLLPLPEPAKGD